MSLIPPPHFAASEAHAPDLRVHSPRRFRSPPSATAPLSPLGTASAPVRPAQSLDRHHSTHAIRRTRCLRYTRAHARPTDRRIPFTPLRRPAPTPLPPPEPASTSPSPRPHALPPASGAHGRAWRPSSSSTPLPHSLRPRRFHRTCCVRCTRGHTHPMASSSLTPLYVAHPYTAPSACSHRARRSSLPRLSRYRSLLRVHLPVSTARTAARSPRHRALRPAHGLFHR
jgi:hypothetical protein